MIYQHKSEEENRQRLLQQVTNLLKDCEDPDYHWVLNKAARKRPWRPKRTGWKNFIDQILHAAYGAILLLPVLLFDSFLGAGLMGLLAGGIREVEQFFNRDLKVRMIWDRILDTFGFIIGALLIFHFFH